MRMIVLNTWGGRALYPLMRFFRKYAGVTDIFCLQEVRDSDYQSVDRRYPDEHLCGPLFAKIAAELKDFDGYFAGFSDDPHRMSVATFVRQDVPILALRDFVVYEPERPIETGSTVFSPRKLQYVLTYHGNILIANYHGLWNNGPKTDTPERIDQSLRIRAVLDEHQGPKILCGDLNLLPDTQSIGILEYGMRNLIRDYKVGSTRTVLYRHHDNPAEPKFVDYVFASPQVQVEKFEVLPDLVSDHAPLRFEFHV